MGKSNIFIHSPQPWDKVNQSEDRCVEGNRAAWRALEDAYKMRKLQAIGVSNFLQEDIDFVITDEDIEILKYFEKIKDYGEHGFFPVFGGKL